MLEVCDNGADVIDVAMEPLSWGKIHPDVITIREMLIDAGYKVADINMDAYMKARALTQEFIDDFLGYFINPSNMLTSSLLVGCGLPGGMMGSMMADLKGVHAGINMHLRKKGEPGAERRRLARPPLRRSRLRMASPRLSPHSSRHSASTSRTSL